MEYCLLRVSSNNVYISFHFYPIRDKESKRDSFYDAWTYESFRALDEPNLSLKPMPAPVFRFTYSEALRQDPIIISLTPEEIIVKTARYTEELPLLPDTNHLVSLINASGYWQFPPQFPCNDWSTLPIWEKGYTWPGRLLQTRQKNS
jgi:hypothetical protein